MTKSQSGKSFRPLIVAASDNETMSKLAQPNLSATFDVFPLISRWSLEFQAGKKYGLSSILRVADRALQEIVRLAFNGNSDAAKSLHNILNSVICDFDELCQLNEPQAFFEPIAQKTSV
jgi:hypothetical protein